MTQLTHCDGPGCTESWDPSESQRWCQARIHVEPYDRDFCSRACLARWAAPTTAPTQGDPA